MKNTNMYSGYRYPSQIISHTVWLYYRFTLSFRDIEELLAARYITVSYETIRQWCQKFGQKYSHTIKNRSTGLGMDNETFKILSDVTRRKIGSRE